MKLTNLVAIMSLAILTGCASVNMADPAKDQAAKSFKAPANAAGVYIYRNETFGAAIKMDIEVNGKNLGQTASKTYFYTEVPPGKTTITSKAETTDTLVVDTEPGVLYYVWQEVKLGIMSARSKLNLVTANEGKKGVNESKLAQSN